MATKRISNQQLKSHIETLGNAGNLNATPGSRPWAIAVRLEMQSVLNDITFNARQLKAWRDLMKKQVGYRQLVNEGGKAFKTYEQFCKAKPPFGLGCVPSEIDQVIQELELGIARGQEVEDPPPKYPGKPEGYFQRFSKVVNACPDNQPINTVKIAKILKVSQSTANIWRKRWLDLGWIEPLAIKKRGYYQITDRGIKILKEWLETESSYNKNSSLWLTIPRHNPQKVADKLIESLNSEQLREIVQIISTSLTPI
ncbi:MAG: hypothetical protein F6K48_08825 [Okeania sp. SIO3H1]|nr:hypothetical protein [Okeania sp. SIO3H1]